MGWAELALANKANLKSEVKLEVSEVMEPSSGCYPVLLHHVMPPIRDYVYVYNSWAAWLAICSSFIAEWPSKITVILIDKTESTFCSFGDHQFL